ncbi:hypothetical protein C8Q75DRAFT_712368 [Abortiporus biennis]|nr:hypothetical protein C8Q75DRAFT_712368 [Abortiporus biennis]
MNRLRLANASIGTSKNNIIRVLNPLLARRTYHFSPRSIPKLESNDNFGFVDADNLNVPFVLSNSFNRVLPSSRSQELLGALRSQPNNPVVIELGRYNDPRAGQFDQVEMPLKNYIDWLDDPSRTDGTIFDKQVYLAQWRAADEISAVKDLIQVPSDLEPLLSGNIADLYQTSFFIGPTGSVSPLHFDPYMNLYHLQASSNPSYYAKHFTLLPPSVSHHLQNASTRQFQRNTSSVDLHLVRKDSESGHPTFDIKLDSSLPDDIASTLTETMMTCTLREGETLFIPRGWWHRVENVSLVEDPRYRNIGWTAGVAWWFLLRGRSSS